MSTFNQAFLDFFKNLEQHNSKEWFDENRKLYEKEVKNPFKAFVTEMIERIQQVDPEVQIQAKDAMFRINRDVRFSKDKSPYQTHVSANISRGGKKSMDPGFYFQLNHKHLLIGGGAYMLDKDLLQKVRTEISYSLEEFDSLIKDKTFKKYFSEIKGEKNKIIPADFKATVNEQPLIANKQFYYMIEVDAKHIIKSNLADFLMEYFMAGKKVNDFLRRAMDE